MATSVAECDAMIEASRVASGASLMVAHCWRFRDEVIALRDRIAAGRARRDREDARVRRARRLGAERVVHRPRARGRRCARRHGRARDRHREVPPGRPGCPDRVCAAIGTRYADGRYTVDDDGIVLIRWANGTNSVVESGWWQPHLGGLEADTEVYGTGGYARIWPPEPPSEDYEHCTQPMYSAQVAEFLDAIAEGRTPRPSGEDGRVVMRVVEAAYRSAGED